MHNPFFYGGAIEDPRYFVGRRAELARILALGASLPGQAQHVNVTGPRRIGKSSLLKMVQALAPARLPATVTVVYLDGQRYTTPEAFLLALGRALGLNGTPDAQAIGFRLEARHRDGQGLLLLLDELEALVVHRFPNAFFERLRSWAGNNLVALVVATHKPVAELVRVHGLTSPFFNLFGDVLELGPLTEAEAEELLARAAQAGLPFREAEKARIKAWARQGRGYHPAKLQLMAREVFWAKTQGTVDWRAVETRVETTWTLTRPQLPWWQRWGRRADTMAVTLGRWFLESILRRGPDEYSPTTARLWGWLLLLAPALAVFATLLGYGPQLWQLVRGLLAR